MKLDILRNIELSSKVKAAFADGQKRYSEDIGAHHFPGSQAKDDIQESLEKIYELVGAKGGHQCYLFNSELEAAKELFSRLYFKEMQESGKNFIAVPETENATLLRPLELYSQGGVHQVLLPVNEHGQITKDILEEHLSPKVAMLALSWVEPLTGVIHPIWEIADFCQKNDVKLYVQANDIFGKLFFRFQDLPIDFLSFEGQRAGGPTGLGVLFARDKQFMKGYTSQFELAKLMAQGVAAEELLDQMDFQAMEVARLRNQFEDRIGDIPGVQFFGKSANRLPNISSFAIPGIDAEALAYRLYKLGLIVSLGGGREQKLEQVLRARGIDPAVAIGAMSVGFSLFHGEEDVTLAAKKIIEEAHEMQEWGVR